MEYNLVTNLENCFVVINEILNNNFAIVYYSCIPTALISLIIGFFVFFKSKYTLASKILLAFSITFSLWTFFDFVIWRIGASNSRIIMFSWALLEVLDIMFFLLSLYFVYVFVDKKDIPISKKLLLSCFLLPIVFLIPTDLGITGFGISDCSAIESSNFLNYIFFAEVFISLWIIVVLISRYKKAEKEDRRQIIILGVGIMFFLLSFFTSGYMSEYAVENGFIGGYEWEFYGLFGMPIFVGFLAYLIVKYKAFDIKLIGAQALVVALVVLIGSQFFFITSNINRVLTGITLAMAVGFGIFLIRSVQNEIRRKEELQYLTEKLAIANDELRKLDNAKSEFISIASHQLRTPLTSIKGYISLLLEGNYGKIDEVIMDPISKIYASNERLIQLVEELLNVSRIESGRMEYIFEKSSIEKITTALKDTFSVIAKGKGLYMHLNMPSEPLPEIEIDAGKTREVISNLIDNALKYTRRGGITVKAELLKDMNWSVKHAGGQDEDLSGDVVRITISDTGIGVPETELPYLFSKFSRGKDTSRLHVSGTGLGLYVGRNIIEAQHGKIWVESEGLNKGSKFIIDLPVVQPK